MTARDPEEKGRVSSPLELLFDLTFVIAIAQLTVQFAHGIAAGHSLELLLPFLMAFFAIWWAWMNFTWFASSYDTDDVPYRLLTMLQMAGVLVLAAGVPAAFNQFDYRAVTIGYFVMRVAFASQWLRVGIEHPESRAMAFRYAAGVSILQLGWLVRLLFPQAAVPTTLVLIVLELLLPMIVERWGAMSWHPHHIAERFGLFVIIVLGESVLAASNGLQTAMGNGAVGIPLVVVALSAVVLMFSLWWLYFLQNSGDGLAKERRLAYVWGYGHYGIFASLAALGAGLEVAVSSAGHPLAVSQSGIGFTIAIPVAVYLVLLWRLNAPLLDTPVIRPVVVGPAALVILVAPEFATLIGLPALVAVIAITSALAVAVTIAMRPKPEAVAHA
jgi:low temperature requirement protein LtrA